MLPYVLAAIVGATMLRSILLYAQTVETNRIVMRLTTDMQRVGFRASDHVGLRPPVARYAGPARLQADQRHRLRAGGGAGRAQHGRPRHAVDRRPRRLDDLSRLGDVGDRAVRLPDRRTARRRAQQEAAPRRQADAGRARRHDLAADREAVGRAADQVVPAGGLRRRPAQQELRARLQAAHEGGDEPRAHRSAARSARRHRHRRRHRARLLAHRQRHLDRRRLHGLHHRAADGVAADPRARQPVGPHQRRPRRGRELLRARRREAADRRPAGRQAARPRRRTHPFRGRRLCLRPQTACRRSPISRSTCRAATRWRSSGVRAPANRRCSIWCRACSTSSRAASPSTARTFAT